MLGATVFGGNAVTDERNWVYMSPPHGSVTFLKRRGDSVTYPDKDRNCHSFGIVARECITGIVMTV